MSLTLPADDRALMRREHLLAAHQELRISAGTGFWQAEIDELRGMTIITRYTLGELLDRAEAVLAMPIIAPAASVPVCGHGRELGGGRGTRLAPAKAELTTEEEPWKNSIGSRAASPVPASQHSLRQEAR